MAIDLFTRRVAASEAPSIVPPETPVLVPGRQEDIERLANANHRYELWKTHLSGPARSRQEEKWYRALVGVVAEGIGKHPDNLHWDLKLEAGKIISIVQSEICGHQIPVLQSSTQMDHDEFDDYVRIATEIMFAKHLPGVRRKDVFARVFELTGLKPPKH